MGRGRNGAIDQSMRLKTCGSTGRRGDIGGYFMPLASRKTKKILVPEQAIEFMKSMDPQQLADFLLQDDWYVKTSSGNVTGC